MTPDRQPPLDIRERPNGSVVIKRYPFETVFNADEWKELCEYCAIHTTAPAPASETQQREEITALIRDFERRSTEAAKAAREQERKELLKDLQLFIDNADSHIGCPNGTLGTAYLVQWMGGQGWDCD